MELSQLRAFLAAAQYENMTRAAESLHVTQPALSRTIARLEQELGVQSDDVEWQRLRSEPMGVILSRDHPLAACPALSVGQLRGQRFYCNNSNSDSYDLTRYFCAQAGFEPDVCYARATSRSSSARPSAAGSACRSSRRAARAWARSSRGKKTSSSAR